MPKAAGRKTGSLFCWWVFGGSGAYLESGCSYLFAMPQRRAAVHGRGREFAPAGEQLSCPRQESHPRSASAYGSAAELTARLQRCVQTAAGNMKDFHEGGAQCLCSSCDRAPQVVRSSAGTWVAGCASLLTFLHKQESKAPLGAARPATAQTINRAKLASNAYPASTRRYAISPSERTKPPSPAR